MPVSVINKHQESDNLIGSVASYLIPGLEKKRFKVGMNYYTESLDQIFSDNPETPSRSPVTISVYNQFGQRISDMFHHQPDGGQVTIRWDRLGMDYSYIKPGIYFVRIEQDGQVIAKKVVLD